MASSEQREIEGKETAMLFDYEAQPNLKQKSWLLTQSIAKAKR